MKDIESGLTASRLRDLLDYNPATGVFTWKARSGRGSHAVIGTVAGAIHPLGYRKICLFGRRFFASRLAWLHVTGDWPAEEVDHVNGGRADDRFANLRPAALAENRRNRRCRKDSASKFKGVFPRGRRWYAAIGHEYRRLDLGSFSTREEAHAVYLAAAKKLHGKFASPG